MHRGSSRFESTYTKNYENSETSPCAMLCFAGRKEHCERLGAIAARKGNWEAWKSTTKEHWDIQAYSGEEFAATYQARA
jgi:hypothetical protein